MHDSLPEAVPVDNVGFSVAGATHTRAKRDLKAGKPYRVGAQSFYENAQVGLDAEGKVVPVEAGQKDLYVALISDRGLWCCLAF